MIEINSGISDGTSDSESSSVSSTPLTNSLLSEETVFESNGAFPEDERLPESISPSFNHRAYQLEMRDESLKRNIIAAMDTGSGKTHIAVLRIIDELNSSPVEKIVWFLAPSVDLCIQQHKVLELEIPSVQVKILQGNDGVEKWKDKRIWDSFLRNVRVVVSTPQILLDAFTHGFVRLSTLSLIVFDEAHNAVKNSPTAKIMRVFYHPRKDQGQEVPHILGLSASPIMKSNLSSPEIIEETLDAICRTPKRNREELMQYVNLPKFHQITFTKSPQAYNLQSYPPTLRGLFKIYNEYDMKNDPHILRLQAKNDRKSEDELTKLLSNRKTLCCGQLKSFYATGLVIFQELGAWAADYYVTQTVTKFAQMFRESTDYFIGWRGEEKRHLYKLLSDLDLDIPVILSKTPEKPLKISDKVQKLITVITHTADKKISGIVFVQQRATAIILRDLLSLHPAVCSQLRIGFVIGSSNNSQRSDILRDLIRPPVASQGETLDQFRRGELDLIIATNVLEEGIDVPACNAVICFDAPSNLKSFVQRKGRARMKESILLLMQDRESNKLTEWQLLEEEMKKIYADDMRVLREMEALEDLEAHDGRQFFVKKTG